MALSMPAMSASFSAVCSSCSAADCSPSLDMETRASSISAGSGSMPSSATRFMAPMRPEARLALMAFFSRSTASTSCFKRSFMASAAMEPFVSGILSLAWRLSALVMRDSSRAAAAACSSSSVSFSSMSVAFSASPATMSACSASTPTFLAAGRGEGGYVAEAGARAGQQGG